MEKQYWLFNATTRKYTETNFFTEQPENSVDFEPTVTDAEKNAVLNEEGTAWVDCRTESVLNAEKATIYEQKIIEFFMYLMNRALSSSMGKYGSYEYLQIQKREYDQKYQVAKGLVVNIPVAESIQKEMERDFPEPMLDAILTSYGYNDLSGTPIEKMYALIIIRYEYALGRLNNYESKAIDFRTKCRTLVENLQWSKLDTAFELVQSLPNELTDTEIESFYSTFDAL
jgi:hypothetical protein